ncbi:hypothetical protein PC129_g16850 [Phytophthora cactorum]|uniref:Uncharacterized protein n=1 Tax=Phytophthora cactorum TaxID=29920 RepID=A0A329S814_9STRA|nr:hypothetical protein Pcac1_g7034 [Phytophthora cactorum]KAG2808307.1 hypothetical protein PC112_g17014 [Phytophthora cactorum]KAG2810469.1 hypothetical protein PC111_g15637 [Phytophthora cactorum]KAG2850580.1 hypothetical protein PC113_g16653 [Phytophthora cactorum]KAG2888894.1 hypothetical protein PC114_g18197 [Phytophthora cactorum]
MDLSMILSPALEEEQSAPRAAPLRQEREPSRKWSADELQCAVAILQDFQQPSASSPVVSQVDVRSRGGVKPTPYYTRQEQEYKQEEQEPLKPIFSRSADNAVQAAAAGSRQGGEEPNKRKTQEQNPSSAAWEEDNLSKLDLLVQADAVIKRRPPKTPSSPSSNYLRSGVWSLAEEEYAAALVSFFLEGLLDLPEGVTLRKFLAEKLCCNRRRVSMKLGTESLAGRRIPRKVGASVFVAANPPPSEEVRQEVECELAELREANFTSGVLNSHRYYGEEDGVYSQQRRLYKLGEYEEDDDDALRLHQKAPGHGYKRKAGRNDFKPKRGKPTIIRTGFESPEEEEFVTTMFEYFTAGSLDLPEGTKLVTYLCQQLGCTPKQLSMKLAPQRMGERKFPDNVGSITYVRKVTGAGNASSGSSDDDDFSEELFEVESRITELRLAHEEAHKNVPPPVATPGKRERKLSTASVSSMGTASVASTLSVSPVRVFRRSGPWSHDEEVYAAALIDAFFKGVLDVAEGTTLRAFLSSRLCCNPMRISKKLASESIAEIPIPKKLGSSTYVRNVEVTPEEHAGAEDALRNLQSVYIHLSSNKRRGAVGSKRQHQSRGRRIRTLVAALNTDSDGTESDSDVRSIASRDMSPGKLQKTAKTHSPAQEARRQRFNVPHASPKLVVPAPLKEQLA